MSRKSAKTHAPTDTVQTALRMKGHEHARLVDAAKAHRSTLNQEIMWRVSRTFEKDVALAVQDTVRELLAPLEPYLSLVDERGLYNDALFAARQLIDLINPLLAAGVIEGRAGQKARAAIENFHLARHNIELRFGESGTDVGNADSDEFREGAEKRVEAAGGEAVGDEAAWNDEAVRVRSGGFPNQGAAEWPLDLFTRNRLRDGPSSSPPISTSQRSPPDERSYPPARPDQLAAQARCRRR